jgi:chorismate mutase
MATRTKVLLDHVDHWLLQQPTLINKKRRCLLPVLKERTQLADALGRYLQALGLERKAKEVDSLASILASHDNAEPAQASAEEPAR